MLFACEHAEDNRITGRKTGAGDWQGFEFGSTTFFTIERLFDRIDDMHGDARWA